MKYSKKDFSNRSLQSCFRQAENAHFLSHISKKTIAKMSSVDIKDVEKILHSDKNKVSSVIKFKLAVRLKWYFELNDDLVWTVEKILPTRS